MRWMSSFEAPSTNTILRRCVASICCTSPCLPPSSMPPVAWVVTNQGSVHDFTVGVPELNRQMITVPLGITGSFRPCEVQLLQLVKVHQMRNLRSSSNFDLIIKTFVRIFYSKKLNQPTPGLKKSLKIHLYATWMLAENHLEAPVLPEFLEFLDACIQKNKAVRLSGLINFTPKIGEINGIPILTCAYF